MNHLYYGDNLTVLRPIENHARPGPDPGPLRGSAEAPARGPGRYDPDQTPHPFAANTSVIRASSAASP